MKISATLFSFLLASAAAKKHIRGSKRNLQFDPNSNPLQDIMDALQNGFNGMINPDISAIQAMDPLTVLDGQPRTFILEDPLNLTSCTGPINVTVLPGAVTGLSTLTMDRFELVGTQMQGDTNDPLAFLSRLLEWSGTFDMLATADELVWEGGLSIATEDMSCLGEGAPEGPFSSGVKVSMVAPVLDMKLTMGGETASAAQSFFDQMLGNGGQQVSVVDTIETDDVSFTYDSWTLEFDNPMVNQTFNVDDLIETMDLFLSNALNTTGFDVDAFAEDFGLDTSNMQIDGINNLIQDQVNAVTKGAGFSF